MKTINVKNEHTYGYLKKHATFFKRKLMNVADIRFNTAQLTRIGASKSDPFYNFAHPADVKIFIPREEHREVTEPGKVVRLSNDLALGICITRTMQSVRLVVK